MRRKSLLILFLLFLPMYLVLAQKDIPKWVDKAKRAVFTVITYDKEGNMLHTGNGFFISEDGVACSDYSLFIGAEKAIINTFEAKQYPVKSIMGIDEMYDVIKFRVEIDKNVSPLTIATAEVQKGDDIYLLPYSAKKERNSLTGKIEEVSSVSGGFKYYTLALDFNEKMVSYPIMTGAGEVIGLLQNNAPGETNPSYAIDVSFVKSLSLSALKMNNTSLSKIGIKKALPEQEEQALAYLFLRSGGLSADDYLDLLNDFVSQFPASSEGYLRRATHYAVNFKDDASFQKAEEDLRTAEKTAEDRGNVYFNAAKIIYSNVVSQEGLTYKDWGLPKALTENGKALAIDSLPLYMQQRAEILFAMQDYEQAYTYYDKVNHSNFSSPASYYSAAKTKELMGGEGREVIALLDSALTFFTPPLSLDAAPYLLERAQVKMNNELFREAVEDYDQYYFAVNGQVNDLFFYYREQANYHSKNFIKALEDIQKANELNPGNVTYLAELGAVNLRLSKFEEAIGNLQEALTIDPDFAACYRLIGFCQIHLNRQDEACKNFNKAKELGDEAVDSLLKKYCK